MISSYNNTKHRTIGMKPKDVNRTNEAEVMKRFRYKNIGVNKNQKFKIGDKVRISKYKNIFEKSYTTNFTTELFTVVKVYKTNPITYIWKDY